MRSHRPDAPGAATCRCGCPATEHDHHRPGTDCGHCGNDRCEVYRPIDAPAWHDLAPGPAEQVAAEGLPHPDAPDSLAVAVENALEARKAKDATRQAAAQDRARRRA